jgi:2',3'-cyclic-nucleotide 2'-phosphodiesterase (5'-nucleotidase family)
MPEQSKRGAFLIQTAGALKTSAMAVGARDLSAGIKFLKAEAQKNQLPLLSANLVENGLPVFEGSTTVVIDGRRIAIVGVSPPGPIEGFPELQGSPLVLAVKQALAQLKARDATILLAAVSYADALQLSAAVGPAVDVIIQSGDLRGMLAVQRLAPEEPWIVSSGQRGQALGLLQLQFGKDRGAFGDFSNVERDAARLVFVESQLQNLEQRMKGADAASKKMAQKTMQGLSARRNELRKAVEQQKKPQARGLRLTWKLLGNDVIDDPLLKRQILTYEPTGRSPNH